MAPCKGRLLEHVAFTHRALSSFLELIQII